MADPLPPDFTGLQITTDVIVSVIIGEPDWKPWRSGWSRPAG
ncbi:hypothetical protein ACFVYA_31170 [Amycolatopsis sp. NPDC058278]